MKPRRNRLLRGVGILVLLMLLFGAVVNYIVVDQAGKKMAADYPVAGYDADCILILGARVYSDGRLSPMLKDRVDRGIQLYEEMAAPKILMSGDNSQANYNEVYAMREYAIEAGVPGEDIYTDHAGFSTYESMYRAQAIFQVERPIIVTQKYHLYRGVYTANALGMEALGIWAEDMGYAGQTSRDLREVAARIMDFVLVRLKLEPTYLGDPVPIQGDPQEW